MIMHIPDYYYVIWSTAFVTAIVSAVVGMIGGTLLLATMAQFLRMEVLIPVHGIIQLSSNTTRAWFLRSAIDWKITAENIVGIIIGSMLGYMFVIKVPEHIYNILLGVFILGITFVPKIQAPMKFSGRWAVTGFIASSIGLYVGAVGIFVGSVFIAEKLPKKVMISTQAACQAALHFAKVIVFMGLGFVLKEWWLLLIGGIIMTYMGSWVGTKILDKIPEKIFRKILIVLITVLAGRLVYLGVRHMFV